MSPASYWDVTYGLCKILQFWTVIIVVSPSMAGEWLDVFFFKMKQVDNSLCAPLTIATDCHQFMIVLFKLSTKIFEAPDASCYQNNSGMHQVGLSMS